MLEDSRGTLLLRCLCLLGLVPAGGGCDFGAPRVAAPDWKPERLAAEIMATLDADQDGTLNDEELKKSPGLLAGKLPLDTNEDSLVDESELQARFALYKSQRTGLQSKSLQFTYRQKPLVDATVRLQPEPFLQGLIEPAEGKTNRSGVVTPQTATANVPAVRLGYYRVQVTSDQVELPAKYNEDTELGVEVSPVSDGQDYNVRFDLN